MLLFLVFFPREDATVPEEGGEHHDRYTFKQALLVVALSIVHFFVVFLVSVVLLARFPHKLQLWANILGLTATCLASIQYIPQIHTTWRLQHVYSLSIPMMLIQTPGSFVFATSLAVRLGASGWSAWGVYIVTGCLQGVLLGMGIYFWLRDRKEQKAQAAGSQDHVSLPLPISPKRVLDQFWQCRQTARVRVRRYCTKTELAQETSGSILRAAVDHINECATAKWESMNPRLVNSDYKTWRLHPKTVHAQFMDTSDLFYHWSCSVQHLMA